MSHLSTVARYALVALVSLSAAAAVTGCVLARLYGFSVLSVQSDSMKPAFEKGDALVIRRMDNSVLRPGDIVSFRSAHGQMTVTHRVITKSATGGSLLTKGDNTEDMDPPVAEHAIIGKALAVAPRLGVLIEHLKSPYGLIVGIYLPLATLIWHELRRAYGKITVPQYKLTRN